MISNLHFNSSEKVHKLIPELLNIQQIEMQKPNRTQNYKFTMRTRKLIFSETNLYQYKQSPCEISFSTETNNTDIRTNRIEFEYIDFFLIPILFLRIFHLHRKEKFRSIILGNNWLPPEITFSVIFYFTIQFFNLRNANMKIYVLNFYKC